MYKIKNSNTRKDMTGLALESHLIGNAGKTLVHRDDGFVDREPIERYFKRYESWPAVEKTLLDSKVRGSVLETGCSIGMHISYLQRKGLDVTGVDISPHAIKMSEDMGIKNCVCMDARDMHFDKKFDTILMLYYGFGLGGSVDGQVELMNRLYQLTNIGGQIIASSIDALATTNPIHITYQDFNKTKGKDCGDNTQVTLRLEHEGAFGDWYNLLFVNPEGLHSLVSQTKWKIDAVLPEKEDGRAWYYILIK